MQEATTPGQDQLAPVSAQAARKRRHLITTLLIAGFAIVVVGILGYGLKIDPTRVPPANIDKAAEPLSVGWVQGQELLASAQGQDHFTLANLRGKPVILNFWASWCVSCREEAREMEAFWEMHKDQVQVVGVAIQDTREDAKKFANYYGKTYILGLDEDGKAAIDYGVSGVPETFLIDKNGVIRAKEIGPVDRAGLEKLLPKIL